MEAYAGEVQAMHPFYAYDSPARAKDMDLATTKAYALPGNLTAGIQHGSWSMPVDSGRPSKPSLLNSNSQSVYEDLKYSKEDIAHVEEWVKRHVETTWHSLGVSLSILITVQLLMRYRLAPWRRKRETASSSMVFLMSALMFTASRTSRSLIFLSALTMWGAIHVSPSLFDIERLVLIRRIDSTALLIGEKCAMLVAEDLGYSGEALEMKVCCTQAPIPSHQPPPNDGTNDGTGPELSCPRRALGSCFVETLNRTKLSPKKRGKVW
jgi:alcohol oxidase